MSEDFYCGTVCHCGTFLLVVWESATFILIKAAWGLKSSGVTGSVGYLTALSVGTLYSVHIGE
jgi:hypothetical protein